MRFTRRQALLAAAAAGAAAVLPSPAMAGTGTQALATIPNAAYSWWAQPLAVNDGAHTWIATVARMGTHRLFKVNPATAQIQTVELSREFYPNRPDDHNTPAIAFDPDRSHLMVFYTGHNHDARLRYRSVDRTTLALGPERVLTFSGAITYAQVLYHAGRMVVLTRVASSTWRYRISDDFGESWGPERVLMDARPGGFGQVYVIAKPVNDAGESMFAFYGHPVNSRYRNVDLAKIHFDSLDVTTMTGQVVANLFDAGGPGFEPGRLDAAITPTGNHRVRLLDLSTINGRPAICYAVWNGGTSPAAYKVKMYRDGRFVTPPWSLATGDPFGFNPATKYVGGLVVGRGDHLYSARRNNGTGGWHVEQWAWSETQGTFTLDRELARDAHSALARPFVPSQDGATNVIFQRIKHYGGYTDYDIDTHIH